MRTAFASFLLFAAAMALLGGVALACAMLSRVAAPLIPTPADMPTENAPLTLTAQFCNAPMPICTGDDCKRRSRA